MNWIKKILGASILTSLFFIAPETAQAEMCVSCGLINTGGYNLYSLGQNMGSLSQCLPATTPMVVPTYLSNPSAFLSSFSTPTYSWGGNCGTFTQSCGSTYDTVGWNGCGTLPVMPSVNNQLMQLIAYQTSILNQYSNPYSGGYFPGTNPGGPITIQPYPLPTVYNPYNPYNPGLPGTTPPILPYDNSVPFPTSPGLTYGGCDNITVMCPQPGVNPYYPPGGTTNPTPYEPTYDPNVGTGSVPPNLYQIPRGFRTHR